MDSAGLEAPDEASPLHPEASVAALFDTYDAAQGNVHEQEPEHDHSGGLFTGGSHMGMAISSSQQVPSGSHYLDNTFHGLDLSLDTPGLSAVHPPSSAPWSPPRGQHFTYSEMPPPPVSHPVRPDSELSGTEGWWSSMQERYPKDPEAGYNSMQQGSLPSTHFFGDNASLPPNPGFFSIAASGDVSSLAPSPNSLVASSSSRRPSQQTPVSAVTIGQRRHYQIPAILTSQPADVPSSMSARDPLQGFWQPTEDVPHFYGSGMEWDDGMPSTSGMQNPLHRRGHSMHELNSMVEFNTFGLPSVSASMAPSTPTGARQAQFTSLAGFEFYGTGHIGRWFTPVRTSSPTSPLHAPAAFPFYQTQGENINVAGVIIQPDDIALLMSPDSAQANTSPVGEVGLPVGVSLSRPGMDSSPRPHGQAFFELPLRRLPRLQPSSQISTYTTDRDRTFFGDLEQSPAARIGRPARPRSVPPTDGSVLSLDRRRGSSLDSGIMFGKGESRQGSSAYMLTQSQSMPQLPLIQTVTIPRSGVFHLSSSRGRRETVASEQSGAASNVSSDGDGMFINFTSKDGAKLLTGVAPSGSSKRKRDQENASKKGKRGKKGPGRKK